MPGSVTRDFKNKSIGLLPLDLFPNLNLTEQHLSVALYGLLAAGRPVTGKMLADQVGLSVAEVGDVLKRWHGVNYDDAHRIFGYWGLTLSETKHRFNVNERLLYTWCAWDALFIPEILGARAHVASQCADSGDWIRLIVEPHGIISLEPENAVLSFVTADRKQLEEDVIRNFCSHGHFFRSGEAGQQWAHERPGILLLTIEDGWRLGRVRNAAQYPDVMALAGQPA